MRKFPKILGLIFTVILFGSTSIFADDGGPWRYAREVTYDNKEEVKAIYLDEEVYPYAKKDLSDIRLINDRNEFVPYYIYNGFISMNTGEYVKYTSEEVLSFTKDNDYVVDYAVKPKGQNTDVIGNIMALDVIKDTFYKEVQILGSYDNKSWDNIKTDIIYNVNGQSKTQISLGGTYKYGFYRLISLNDTTGVPISALNLMYDYRESTYEQYNKSKGIDYKLVVDKDNKETIVNIHNKERLRISQLKLKSNNDFNRDYQVYVADAQGEQVQQVAMGSIYKFNLEDFEIEDMKIPLKETMEDFIAPEYLQIVIKDRDDKPIHIEAIEIDYYIDKIVFKTNDLKGIKLLYGNELAEKPNYDISTYMVEMEQSKQETAQLLEVVEREVEEIKEDKGFDYKWILNISVVAIAGLLSVIILKKK